MRGREIPPVVGWVVVAVVVVAAGYFVWRAGTPSRVEGGKPNAQDRELLRIMGEARAKSGAGRGAPAAGQPTQPQPR